MQLAGRLGAPVFHTAMGKGAFPGVTPPGGRHALVARDFRSHRAWLRSSRPCSPRPTACWPWAAASPRWRPAAGRIPARRPLAQIDVDPEEIGRHYPVQVGLAADARAALEALLEALPDPAGASRGRLIPPRREPWGLPGLDLVGPLRRVLPADAIVAADVTRLAYILMAELPLDQPRTFLHPAGSVAMGYALPAALGAKAAWPRRPVVAVAGDGGFLMSGMELATAVQEGCRSSSCSSTTTA